MKLFSRFRLRLFSPQDSMSAHRLLALALCAALAACAQPSPRDDESGAPAPKKAPRIVIAKPEAGRPALPDVDLSEELLFKMMVAEIAVQRGQPHIAVQTYLELARTTRDPRIAQRATEIAWNARFNSAALEAAGIWLQVDPGSAQARQIIAALLVNQAQLADTRPHLEKWIAADRANVGQSFLQLSSLLGRHKDKAGVFSLMRALAEPYAEVPEARLAVAQAAWNANEQQASLDQARAALKLRPDWEIAALPIVLDRRPKKSACGASGRSARTLSRGPRRALRPAARRGRDAAAARALGGDVCDSQGSDPYLR